MDYSMYNSDSYSYYCTNPADMNMYAGSAQIYYGSSPGQTNLSIPPSPPTVNYPPLAAVQTGLVHRVPCLWGGSCPILLDDISAAGIMRHLREYHLVDPDHPWDKKARGVCQWGGECHKEMAYASYGKHVAAVHLRGSVQCPYCYRDVGRLGLLERHIQSYCPHAPPS
ncbi:uncharacterized protein LAESUDRAFT_747780 [Laetiporus sulphureus 93-53]|uniref:Uncharacterized protein n=1 Tax=Laetiporus sulphureus 93-53 TaxID=1314785 RepID=A0A165GJW4_9APHY|nr:uncharacterized protein LAESUDRAFT_747780 [Laetiporus sulphureus 93-53]KZT10454.1 hypothetical protein LAESUDRAFT_747780 [Laetiporus sulphureus 93-53]